MTDAPATMAAKMELLWHERRHEVVERYALLLRSISDLETDGSSEQREGAARHAHWLAGTAGIFRLVETAKILQEVERMLEDPKVEPDDSQFCRLVTSIKPEIERSTIRDLWDD